MKLHFYWHSYKYLPYEYELAQRELITLFKQQPQHESNCLVLDAVDGWQPIAQRTTYFSKVSTSDGQEVIPLQALLEASSNAGIQQESLEILVAPTLRRQSTRYSAHGLHEYRGKFNPQLVRTIGNILGLSADAWVIDPFCGSGTTLLEAAHNSWNAIGIDINPLGVLIAQAKLAAVRVRPSCLIEHSRALAQFLRDLVNGYTFDTAFTNLEVQSMSEADWRTRLDNADYLSAWFTESVLVQLIAILNAIENLENEDVKLICKVVLSDILRDVSLQDPSDLRIRRRKEPMENAPAIPLFLDALARQVDVITKARRVVHDVIQYQQAILADVRLVPEQIRHVSQNRLFDAAITSPPYVNALPYIDTQRLSLAFLNLINADSIRSAEKRLIGNREISNAERMKLEDRINTNADHLPEECIALCRALLASFEGSKDGFRKRNVPALVYQYCQDMGQMFNQVRQLLCKNSNYALVVGPSKTVLGGKEFLIDTPRLLTILGQHNGFVLDDAIKLNTYQRFDVHQANSIRSETLLVMKRI